MILDILAITGFVIGGYILPEIAVLLGSGKHTSPTMLNLFAMVAAGLISANVLLSV